jgi:hypothetical protein
MPKLKHQVRQKLATKTKTSRLPGLIGSLLEVFGKTSSVTALSGSQMHRVFAPEAERVAAGGSDEIERRAS